jgi:hypothetical protein
MRHYAVVIESELAKANVDSDADIKGSNNARQQLVRINL